MNGVPMSEAQNASGVRTPLADASDGVPVMEADNLTKEFRLGRGRTFTAVSEVSFKLQAGTVLAVVGESGSGKSTVAKMLAGQETPTRGVVRLRGAPVTLTSKAAFRAYKSDVQYVFQDPFASLNPIHTVRHHLMRPIRIHDPATRGDAADRKLEELLEQVRLVPAEQYLTRYPHELSGGQRQRVAFARALAAHPSVLLADEPVSMLDVSIRIEMLALLDELRRQFRLGLLYITHDIASARYLADDILVMYRGRVVERGPAEDVTQRAAHPYTQLLITSAPDPDKIGQVAGTGVTAASAPARGMPGLAGSAGHFGLTAAGIDQKAAEPAPDGCPFAPRCPLVFDRCWREAPPVVQLGPGRSAECWRLLDEPAPGSTTAAAPTSQLPP